MTRVVPILILCAACSSKRAPEPAQTGSAAPVTTAVVADAAPAIDAAPAAPDPHVRIAVFQEHGGYGYIDATGKKAFEGTFGTEAPFRGGRACVVVDKHDELIDEQGMVVAKRSGYWCDSLDFTDGFALLDDKVIDRNAKPVATIRFGGKAPDEVHQFSEGLAAVRFGTKWGFVDHTGKLVIEPRFGPDAEWKAGSDDAQDPEGNPMPPSDYYDYVGEIHDGLATARKGDLWGYIDKTGAFAIAPRFTDLPFHPEFHDGLAKFYDGKKVGFMDKTGKPAIAAIYDDATPFSEGVAGVHAERWKYVDRTGKTVFELDPAMTYGDSFSEGLAMIRKGELGKTGTTFCFVDHRGTIVIPCTLARGGTFDHGVAYVDGILIDRTGKKLWP